MHRSFQETPQPETKVMERVTTSRSSSYILGFSLIVGASFFVIRLLQWSLPFPLFLLAFLLQIGLACLLAVAFVWSIVHAVRQSRRRAKAFLPLAINAIVLVLLLNFPFTEVWLKINFAIMQSARNAVVSQIKTKQFTANKRGQVDLPSTYASTSDGGQIQLEGNNILFYTFRGIDNFSGFIYVPSNQEPEAGKILFDGKIVEVEKLKDQWFWVSAT